jgi:hypothetical protein
VRTSGERSSTQLCVIKRYSNASTSVVPAGAPDVVLKAARKHFQNPDKDQWLRDDEEDSADNDQDEYLSDNSLSSFIVDDDEDSDAEVDHAGGKHKQQERAKQQGSDASSPEISSRLLRASEYALVSGKRKRSTAMPAVTSNSKRPRYRQGRVEADAGSESCVESSDVEASDETSGSDESGVSDFDHAAFDAEQREVKFKQRKVRGLGIAHQFGHHMNPDVKLADLQAFHIWCCYLVAGLVLEDGGKSVVVELAGSPDAALWKNVCRSVERRICGARDSLASSNAWKPEARQSVAALPFMEAVQNDDEERVDCQVCGRKDHPSSFRLFMFGSAVPSSDLYTEGTEASHWTDFIPKGSTSHHSYKVEVPVGRYCRQRLECYAALHHFKYWMLLAISDFVCKWLARQSDHEWPRESNKEKANRCRNQANSMMEDIRRSLRIQKGIDATRDVLTHLRDDELSEKTFVQIATTSESSTRQKWLRSGPSATLLKDVLYHDFRNWQRETDDVSIRITSATRFCCTCPWLDELVKDTPLLRACSWDTDILPMFHDPSFNAFTKEHVSKMNRLVEHASALFATESSRAERVDASGIGDIVRWAGALGTKRTTSSVIAFTREEYDSSESVSGEEDSDNASAPSFLAQEEYQNGTDSPAAVAEGVRSAAAVTYVDLASGSESDPDVTISSLLSRTPSTIKPTPTKAQAPRPLRVAPDAPSLGALESLRGGHKPRYSASS